VTAAAPGKGSKASKAEAIYRQLRAEIEQGVLVPGQQLGELMLVERMGVSRTPVREALRRLAAEGLVDFAPRHGARVGRISLQSARELFQFRMLLEPAAMRLVAPLVASDEELRATFSAFERQLGKWQGQRPSARRTREFYRFAEEFDRTVAIATPNSFLSRTILDLRPHTVRLRTLAHAVPERIEVSLVEHQAMCQALLDGNANMAAKTCREHLTQTINTIFDALLVDSRATIDIAL
jgi:DNA-binding GntR family transcriptional regulator